ncbi:hypothetical protein [Nostoc sp. 'Peltigera membranacea cyanobiont' 232]|uniref:hypothetical protein n=1 Tax=Nostoc sp. 'Peltigera membranacea cyanobiont' 232 TaxID=2014531 RepID=UPI001CB9708E|nr:hypothetical protein [Nostoc sp. 'Peltigera membranacea cyanobiont' 232]
MTEAMRYANLQEDMTRLGITDESIAKKAQEIAVVTSSDKEKAKEALFERASTMHEEKVALSQVSIEGVEPINFPSFEINKQDKIQSTITDVENFTSSADKKDDDKNSKNEVSVENKNVAIAKTSDVQQVIIPKLLEVLSNKGEQENGSVVYQGEKYTASIKLEEDSNILSLDRNLDSENRKALVASKNNDEPSYIIVVNNISQEEFERFTLLFNEEQNRYSHQQAQQPINSKSNDNEIE